MGPDERAMGAVTAYVDGQAIEAGAIKEIEMPGVRIDPEQAARLLATAEKAAQEILLTFNQVAAAFSEWIKKTAKEMEAAEEFRKAMRWAEVDNRPLAARYHRAKKKRIRKKYAKRILVWYREEVL